MSKPRYITTTEARSVAYVLGMVIKELMRPDAAQVRRGIRDALDYGYPATVSSYVKQRHNATEVDENGKRIPVQPDTLPEGLAITGDPEAARASTLVADIRQLFVDAESILVRLKARRPGRPTQACPRCGYPFPRGSSQCQQIIDGVKCGAKETSARTRHCAPKPDGCGREMQVGEKLRRNRQKKPVCNACWQKDWRAGQKEQSATVEQERGTSTIDIHDTTGIISTEAAQ